MKLTNVFKYNYPFLITKNSMIVELRKPVERKLGLELGTTFKKNRADLIDAKNDSKIK